MNSGLGGGWGGGRGVLWKQTKHDGAARGTWQGLRLKIQFLGAPGGVQAVKQVTSAQVTVYSS